MNNLWRLYGPNSIRVLLTLMVKSDYRVWRYLVSFWGTQDFTKLDITGLKDVPPRVRLLIPLLEFGVLLQLILALWLVLIGDWQNTAGGVAIGIAVAVAYPLIWAHVLALLILGWKLLHPKRFGKEIVCKILEAQADRLRHRHRFMLIAVAGSVGKTSTKLAIAGLLSETKKVIYEEGNYNDRVTVPLVLFGQREPSILNVFGWLKVFVSNSRAIRKSYPYDVAVIELGTDGPGQMRQFAYLQPDLTVVTAIAPEHMEYLTDLDSVAQEELSVALYSKKLLINNDDVDTKYSKSLAKYTTYGLKSDNNYYATYRKSPSLEGQKVNFHMPGDRTISTHIEYLGGQGAKIVMAAVAVADMLGVEQAFIEAATQHLAPFSGRMQVLTGLDDSVIIDDTYNASPTAVKAALEVLYDAKASKKIAIIGSMNELGKTSAAEHEAIGSFCNPKKVDMVLTIGRDANKYLAPAAVQSGCHVRTFTTPYKAGEYAKKELTKGTVVLAKGSQNGVFAEEAVKVLLADATDASKLVRQSNYWLKVKRSQFGG